MAHFLSRYSFPSTTTSELATEGRIVTEQIYKLVVLLSIMCNTSPIEKHVGHYSMAHQPLLLRFHTLEYLTCHII